jgi:hypothetical protein
MAEISDLTTAEQEVLVAEDFEGLLNRLNVLLGKMQPVNDAEEAELTYVKGRLLILDAIIRASGNTAAITADAILNP